jgi:hypothetical protein
MIFHLISPNRMRRRWTLWHSYWRNSSRKNELIHAHARSLRSPSPFSDVTERSRHKTQPRASCLDGRPLSPNRHRGVPKALPVKAQGAPNSNSIAIINLSGFSQICQHVEGFKSLLFASAVPCRAQWMSRRPTGGFGRTGERLLDCFNGTISVNYVIRNWRPSHNPSRFDLMFLPSGVMNVTTAKHKR